MKRIFKTLGITVFVTVIVILTAGCILEEGIELGSYGGSSLGDAYHLTEGEYVFGFLPSDSDSRWFSVPVVNGNRIYIWVYGNKENSSMINAAYYLYNESGNKFSGGPYDNYYSFGPTTTGKWFIEVISRSNRGAFAITYTNSSGSPPNPKLFD